MGYATQQFSKRLKQIRETTGLTQEQFAKELNVSRGAISYYEKGERTPDIEFLNSLYEYFQCTVPFDFLLGNTDNIKAEHKNMYDFYGLTDKACDKLDESPKLGHIISAILEHDNFFILLRTYEFVIQQYKNFNSCQLGYISFLITDCLNKIIYDSLLVLQEISLTDEEREKQNALFKKTQAEFEELQKIWAEESAANKKHWEEQDKELAAEIEKKDTVRLNSIDKIHDKFFEATDMLEFERFSH